jgi:RHS repeat-associated protein
MILVFVGNVSPAVSLDIPFEYDAAGSLVSGWGKYYEYNDANQLVRVRSGAADGPVTTEYAYDHTGRRVKKTENGQATYYIGREFEAQVADSLSNDTAFYIANGERVARKSSIATLNYYHQDHLGSTRALTDAEGRRVADMAYFPFGESRNSSSERYLYIGKEKDEATDCYYFDARYYNPDVGSFSQADAIDPRYYDPQDLNRYAYSRNSPERNSDPSGHSWFDNVRFVFEKAIDLSATAFEKGRELVPLSHFGNVMERLTGFTSKSLSGLDVGEKLQNTLAFRREVGSKADTRLSPEANARIASGLNQLRVAENAGSVGLNKMPGGVGSPGATMLGTNNLSGRDAPRFALDAQKAKNLVDVYSDPNATEEDIRRADELYNNPRSSPLFPQ